MPPVADKKISKVALCVWVPEALAEDVRAHAERADRTVSSVIRRALRRHLENDHTPGANGRVGKLVDSADLDQD